MTGIADLEATIAKLEEAAADAREVTRELHSAIKAARAAERELTETTRTLVADDIPAAVGAVMTRLIEEGMAAHKDALAEAIADGVKITNDRFLALFNSTIYGNPQGRGPSVLDEVRDRILAVDQLLAQRQRLAEGRSVGARMDPKFDPSLPSLR